MALKKYLEIGKLVNTHGIRGDLKLEAWADSPDTVRGLDTLYLEEKQGFVPMKLSKASRMGNFILVHFEAMDDIDAVLKYKGRIVYADRDDLPIPEGGHFIADLIGLDVFDIDSGVKYGRVTDLYNRGASDIYEIKKTDGGEALVPAVSEFVREIHIIDEDGKKAGIYLRPIKGMFDDAEEIRSEEEER